MEEVNKVLKEAQRRLQEALVDGILNQGLLKTGALANSVRVTYDEKNQELITFMEDYGVYQDSGISGTKSLQSPNDKSLYKPGKFKDSTKMIAGNLPFGARVSIAQKGFRPRPFIVPAYDRVVEQYLDEALLEAGMSDIDKSITNIFKTNGGKVV
jgi:hypothetical protein